MNTLKINSAVAEWLYEDSNYNIGPVLVLRDGSLFTIMCTTKRSLKPLDRAVSSHYVMGRQSVDGGRTWSRPETIIEFPPQPGWICGTHLLQSREGTMHIFSIRIHRYDWENSDFQGDILHTRMDDIHGTNAVTQKVDCLDRYTGAINSLLQTASGRLVVPFSTLIPREDGVHWHFVCSTIYSDDEGRTWHASNDLAVSDGETHLESGAIEPIVHELDDGRVLMLIRTTLGRFYYALSADGGATWGAVKRTPFLSSNSPTSLVSLENGDLVKIWNHCDGYPLHDVISYARQVLHAAVSEDGGQTWSGYREIVRRRPDDPANTHICYPFPTALGGDEVLVKYFTVQSKDGETWAEPYAKLIRFSASFLKERTRVEDFRGGLDAWSTGGRVTLETDALAGSTIAGDSGKAGVPVMQIAAGRGETAVASWNFPYASAGSLKLRLQPLGAARIKLVLSERYLDPHHFTCGEEAVQQMKEAVLTACALIEWQGAAGAGTELELTWQRGQDRMELHFRGTGEAQVAVNGDAGGYSYLTVWLEAAEEAEEQLLLVDRVEAESHQGGQFQLGTAE